LLPLLALDLVAEIGEVSVQDPVVASVQDPTAIQGSYYPIMVPMNTLPGDPSPNTTHTTKIRNHI
jgi:hypothetical protein